MATQPAPVEVFCSYAHEDEGWLHRLEAHLSPLRRQGIISLWHDRLLAPGTDWSKDIDAHMNTASVILLLVSADFFASDYCYGVEMKRALERHEAGRARVIPIAVRKVDWQDAPFAHLRALPTDAVPIATAKDTDTALAEVAIGIRRVIVEDLPLLSNSASRAALPPFWNIPYPRNAFFLGRDEQLAQLHRLLQTGRPAALSQPQAISGLGGIGKTQLALEYAYRYAHEYQAVLWARADSTDALISSYVALASLLRIREREAKEQDVIVQAVKNWLRTQRNWLLILDNADELEIVPDFLPPTLGGHLLLTTRATAMKRVAQRLEIDTLVPEQGALLLLRRAGLLTPDALIEQAAQKDRDQALQLSQELGGLPLALDQAGAYLEETGMNLTDYAQLYQQHRATLLSERGGLVPDHPEPVATTWSLSFENVQKKEPAAAQLLQMAAFLSPDAIPEELFTNGASVLDPPLSLVATDPLRINKALEALRAYSLIKRNPTNKTLSLHRLVQAVLQDTMEPEEKRRWAEQVVLAVNAAFPGVEHATWLQCERLLTQALVAAQWIEQYQFMYWEAANLLYKEASYLKDCARYGEAELFYQRAVDIQKQQEGPEHYLVAYSLNGLAVLYWQEGKYEEAEPLCQRASHIWEQMLGPDHLLVAVSLNNLALLYSDQGRYEEAEPLYRRALHIWEQQLGPDHPDVANSINNLANLYWEQGRDLEAEPLYQRALNIREQRLSLDDPLLATSLNNLANLYYQQGRYEEAKPLYQRALGIQEQQLGPDHPDVAVLLNNLASLYSDQGKYREAEMLYKRALRIWEQQVNSKRPDVATPISGLADLYSEQGKYEDAQRLYERALHIREQTLGLEHPRTRAVRERLAALRALVSQGVVVRSQDDMLLEEGERDE